MGSLIVVNDDTVRGRRSGWLAEYSLGNLRTAVHLVATLL